MGKRSFGIIFVSFESFLDLTSFPSLLGKPLEVKKEQTSLDIFNGDDNLSYSVLYVRHKALKKSQKGVPMSQETMVDLLVDSLTMKNRPWCYEKI